MYKVFYNQKSIHFTSDLSKNSSVTPLFFLKYTDSRSIINIDEGREAGLNLWRLGDGLGD